MSLEIDIERCKGCGLCVDACPVDYLSMSSKTNNKGYFYPVRDSEKDCTGCGLCYTMCADVCIEIS
ncbi:MAG: 4Fe-4S dicluster domain-containing protein [Nanoarchaeota archaeon]|nr:4Fe-4S dicluster domain-containing protein [Nanoarchaeota archaeon]